MPSAAISAPKNRTKYYYQLAIIKSSLEKIKTTRPLQMATQGDYSPRNLLWLPQNQRVLTVLDWEETPFDLPIYDIITTSTMFGKTKAGQKLFMDSYFAALEKFKLSLAHQINQTLVWSNLIYHAGRLAELLLNIRLTVFENQPLAIGYLLKVAEEVKTSSEC